MIEFIDAGIVLGTMAVGFIAGRSTDKTETVTVDRVVEKQVCLYCRTDLVGAKELDLINHNLCMVRTPEEIEAMILKRDEDERVARDEAAKKAAQTPPQKKYRWLNHLELVWSTSPSNSKDWNYDTDTRRYFRYKWEVYRNGEVVAQGYEKKRTYAETVLKNRAVVEKHKVGEE